MSVSPEIQQPVPVSSRMLSLRCLADLQLATIVQMLKPELRRLSGRVLDVGAGEAPWRQWLPERTSYTGLDVDVAAEFGMSGEIADIVYYDGTTMPFDGGSFSAALCIEVMEHAAEPELLAGEMARVLEPGGKLLLSVPWSAREHHVPYDYHR